MITVHAHPAPDPRLLEALVDLINPRTPVHEATDPALPPRVAFVVTPTERLLVVAGTDLTRSEARALVEQAARLDTTFLALIDRSETLRRAVRGWINEATPVPHAS